MCVDFNDFSSTTAVLLLPFVDSIRWIPPYSAKLSTRLICFDVLFLLISDEYHHSHTSHASSYQYKSFAHVNLNSINNDDATNVKSSDSLLSIPHSLDAMLHKKMKSTNHLTVCLLRVT
ncbi:unnamed protein product [Amoebophrya sp. A25]|nr:unnamed protein product [Amoebophrya sp. A25]|eukprot:GSA25T00007050001.1